MIPVIPRRRWDDDHRYFSPDGIIQPFHSTNLRDFFVRNPLDQFLTIDEMVAKPSLMIKNGKFQADFDLRNFDPNGIKVKFDGDILQVNAKQEKKGDGHYEYHEFIRKINIPKEVVDDELKCKLDKDGRLRIEAPIKKQFEQIGRDIPIEIINQK